MSNQIIEGVLELSRAEKYLLMQVIIESLWKDDEPDQDLGLDPEQVQVINRRVKEIDTGKAQFISLEDIKKRIEAARK